MFGPQMPVEPDPAPIRGVIAPLALTAGQHHDGAGVFHHR